MAAPCGESVFEWWDENHGGLCVCCLLMHRVCHLQAAWLYVYSQVRSNMLSGRYIGDKQGKAKCVANVCHEAIQTLCMSGTDTDTLILSVLGGLDL